MGKNVGTLRKMLVEATKPVSYQLPVGEDHVAMNPFLGQKLSLKYSGYIYCIYCGRKTKKSFNQGYCFPCMRSLARTDMCILRPEQCHFHLGTCREPEWGLANCMQKHFIYLANTSGVKVGITRQVNVPTRWIDQGAVAALPIFEVDKRLHSGLIEAALTKHISDKTNWRNMLKGVVPEVDLIQEKETLLELSKEELDNFRNQEGDDALRPFKKDEVYNFEYPVIEYPSKIASFNFDKNPLVEGILMGIKGQYLIFDTGVINIRKFAGYEVTVL